MPIRRKCFVAVRDDGNLFCDFSAAVRCDTADAAIALEEEIAQSQGYAAGWAFYHTYDPTTGHLSPVEVLERCGDLHWCPQRRAWIA